jgi:hypothetical protein
LIHRVFFEVREKENFRFLQLRHLGEVLPLIPFAALGTGVEGFASHPTSEAETDSVPINAVARKP